MAASAVALDMMLVAAIVFSFFKLNQVRVEGSRRFSRHGFVGKFIEYRMRCGRRLQRACKLLLIGFKFLVSFAVNVLHGHSRTRRTPVGLLV
jgi:hypothetical protein